MIGIYVHIPFCESKCVYCDFASFVCEDREKYFKCLINEIQSCKYKGETVDSIYFGGGTPSIIQEGYISTILETIKKNFIVTKDCEITIEGNPNSLSLSKLRNYQKFGINRISIGVQTLQAEQLIFAGRKHTNKEALESIKNARDACFENISVDLIIGLPNSNVKTILQDAKKLVDLGITHISTYILQVEKGTALFDMVEKNPNLLPNENQICEMFEKITRFLKIQGFNQYEVSNFCKEGRESKHNIKYWQGVNYLGFGLSATSTIDNLRWKNLSTFIGYYSGKREIEKLNIVQMIEEKIMLGLRCFCGVDISEVKNLGYDMEKNDNFYMLLSKGVIYKKGEKVFTNPSYYHVNNQIITKLLP